MCHCVLLIDIMKTVVVRPRTILVEISVFSRKVPPSRVLLEYHTLDRLSSSQLFSQTLNRCYYLFFIVNWLFINSVIEFFHLLLTYLQTRQP